MGQRNVFPPEVLNLLEELLDSSEDIEDLLANDISIDDGGDSITIDTDQGPIQVTGTLGSASGDTEFGQAVGIAPNTTNNVVVLNPTTDIGISGFTGNGESDANWTLYINGNPKASQWTNQAEPNADFEFGNPIVANSGDTVELEVENIGFRTADYEGTILIRL